MSDAPASPLPPEIALPALTLQTLLAETGVREFVICAGARNSALLVLLAAVPGLRLWHHFEERSAAFFALGRILDHEQPVAVVTTSGTAAAELLPAMIEAHYQGLPLIALTADRPVHYRGTGAPQAIEQAGLFGPYPTLALDIASLASAPEDSGALANWDRRGPLHLNLCLEEPSAAGLPLLREAGARMALPGEHGRPARDLPAHGTNRVGPELPADGKGSGTHGQDGRAPFPAPPGAAVVFPQPLVIIGDLLPSEVAAVEQFCVRTRAPVYAEAASGLRESPALREMLIHGGDRALAGVPHQSVIRLGGVPACRFWRDLETRENIPVLNYTRSGHSGLARPSSVRPLWSADGRLPLQSAGLARRPDQTALPPLPSSGRKTAASCLPQSGGKPSALQSSGGPIPTNHSFLTQNPAAHPASEPALIRALSKIIPDRAVMFTGNSLAIREWNLCALPPHPIHARALRGANGIDGNLSAFLGLAADAEEAWCLVGDLTALYDLAAPWMLEQLNTPRIRIVVIQNAGGKIFSRLPSLQGLTDFERQLMENPHRISLAGWAQQWGLHHVNCEGHVPDPATLPDRVVIELHPNAASTEAFWKSWAGQSGPHSPVCGSSGPGNEPAG